MKLEKVKHLIDQHFNQINPLDLVKHLEGLGYVFEPLFNDELPTYTPVISQNVIVAEFNEVEGNHLFVDTFCSEQEIVYREKISMSFPSSNFNEESSENACYAMAA